MELETRHCTLCGPSAPKHIKYRERLGAAPLSEGAGRTAPKSHCRMVTCGTCGTVYADPALPIGRLNQLQAQGPHSDSAAEDDRYASYAPLLDRACGLTENRRCFLEIGGASGDMLRFGVEQGFFEQIEVEPAPGAASAFVAQGPRARFIAKPFAPGLLADESVSLACLFQVLGHTDDPLTLTRAVWSALEPGGVALAVVHNVRSLTARLLGERSPIFGMTNMHLFNGNNAYRLFKEAGFDHIEVFTVPNRHSAQHWMQMLPAPKRLKTRALQFLEHSPLGDVKISLHAGNIAVIGRKTAQLM